MNEIKWNSLGFDNANDKNDVVVSFNPCPAEPGFTLFLQTV